MNATLMNLAVSLLGGLLGSAEAQELADPTRPPAVAPAAVAAPAPAPQWRLSLVRLGERGASAVLNGRRVREGDTVEGAEVVRIRDREVVLAYAGREIRVSLVPRPVRVAGAGTGGAPAAAPAGYQARLDP